MDWIPEEILKNVGLASIVIILAILLLFIITISLTYLMFRNTRIIRFINNRISSLIIKILLLVLDLNYMPAKKLVQLLGGNDFMVDIVSTEMRNILFKNSFSSVPFNQRIIVLPQCLRGLDCPARFSSVEGAQCMGCGKCKIKEITRKAKELGYLGVYIAPGGGFVKRIIKKTKPGGVIGVGCPYEVNWGLLEVANKGIPSQAVILLNSGCVTTDVDLNAVYETMELIKK